MTTKKDKKEIHQKKKATDSLCMDLCGEKEWCISFPAQPRAPERVAGSASCKTATTALCVRVRCAPSWTCKAPSLD
jgi:hypothetical protein